MPEAIGVPKGIGGMNVIGTHVSCLSPIRDTLNNISSFDARIMLLIGISPIAIYLAKGEAKWHDPGGWKADACPER